MRVRAFLAPNRIASTVNLAGSRQIKQTRIQALFSKLTLDGTTHRSRVARYRSECSRELRAENAGH
jgi:hypothetical protein